MDGSEGVVDIEGVAGGGGRSGVALIGVGTNGGDIAEGTGTVVGAGDGEGAGERVDTGEGGDGSVAGLDCSPFSPSFGTTGLDSGPVSAVGAATAAFGACVGAGGADTVAGTVAGI